MEYVDNSVYFDKPSSVINNWQVIQDVVKKSGMRSKLIQAPDKFVSEELLKDVTRRYIYFGYFSIQKCLQ